MNEIEIKRDLGFKWKGKVELGIKMSIEGFERNCC